MHRQGQVDITDTCAFVFGYSSLVIIKLYLIGFDQIKVFILFFIIWNIQTDFF